MPSERNLINWSEWTCMPCLLGCFTTTGVTFTRLTAWSDTAAVWLEDPGIGQSFPGNGDLFTQPSDTTLFSLVCDLLFQPNAAAVTAAGPVKAFVLRIRPWLIPALQTAAETGGRRRCGTRCRTGRLARSWSCREVRR